MKNKKQYENTVLRVFTNTNILHSIYKSKCNQITVSSYGTDDATKVLQLNQYIQ